MRAFVHIELHSKNGQVLATRDCSNSVMRGGARLIADLFAGRGSPITHMGVGTSDTPESDAFATEALSNDAIGDEAPLDGGTEATIPIEAFQPPEIDEARRVVRLRLRGTLPAPAAIGTVREAGLLARDDANAVLYNRVTFAPIQKGGDHELTLFWEVSFPYGDLQWLM
jgi:hypothetical protein